MDNIFIFRNRSFLVFLVLLAVSTLLMVLNINISINIRQVFSVIVIPIERGISGIGGFFDNLFNGITRINELEKELQIAQERLINYQEKMLLYSQLVEENTHLKIVLSIKENLQYETVYARIIFRDPTLMGDYYIINKGAMDDIRDNMPVVSFDTNGNIYLVGKISEVSLNASKVKIITAKSFYLGISLQASGYVGILSGQGSWNQNCNADYIPSEADPEIGDRVVTSGESDIFPYGLMVGHVAGVSKSVMEEFFQRVYIAPGFKYSALKEVFILDWRPGAEASKIIENTYEQ
ncbi:MAG: rod shape-determining protein MreC [Spirochaetes bacterium GWF1_51_8]|nr:MAG: rod shape-determining protein MreC [Spirochaetes bacterium GWF1_51_8]